MKAEAEEGLEKIKEALNVCKIYIDTYQSRKINLKNYFKEKPVIEWDFQSSVVFGNFDEFKRRLIMIQVCTVVMPLILTVLLQMCSFRSISVWFWSF